jgi:hypothetical protein
MNNIGELFKLLNSEICNKFYENVTEENKEDIIASMISDDEFMILVNPIIDDIELIKNKIDSKIVSIIKKRNKDIPKEKLSHDPVKEVVASKPDIEQNMCNGDQMCNCCKCVKGEENMCNCCEGDDNKCNCCQCEHDIGYEDEVKGKYIGSGYYLKRVDHLIQMTGPNFVVYY